MDINITSVSFSETTWLVDGTTNVTFDITHDLHLGGVNLDELSVKILFSADSIPDSSDVDSGLYTIQITSHKSKVCVSRYINIKL